jgi:DNA-binding transcriptional regulator YiaG
VLPSEIEKLRVELGWSMSRLAQEMGIPADLIVDWESGQRFPTKKHCVQLQALKVRES